MTASLWFTVDGREQTLPLRGAELVIGRDPSCGLPVASRAVSKRHCRLVLDGAWWIEDLESDNGTFVDGQPVTARRRLNGGDVIRLGPEHRPLFTATFRDAAERPAPRAPAGAAAPAAPPTWSAAGELAAARDTILALETRLARAEADVAALERELRRERAEGARLEELIDRRNETIAQHEREQERLRERLALAEEGARRLERERDRAQERADEAARERDELARRDRG
jgi:hypothetical protein